MSDATGATRTESESDGGRESRRDGSAEDGPAESGSAAAGSAAENGPAANDEPGGSGTADGEPTASTSAVPDGSPVRVRVRADTLRPVLSAVRAVVDECRLSFDPDGIRVAAMDPATVAAVDAELDAGAVESYRADGTVVGVDVDRLDEILSMADADDPVTLALDPDRYRLHVVAGDLEYAMGLVDPENVRKSPEMADLAFEHTAALTLPVGTVGRFVTAAGMVSDHLALLVNPDEETFVAVADGDTDDVRFVVTAAEASAFSAGDAGSLFSLSYLEQLSGAVPSGTDVRLTLGEKAPLGVEYDVADGGGRVEAFVAPRLQSR